MRSLRGLNLVRAGHQNASPCCFMEIRSQATLVHVVLDGGLAGTRQREGLTDVDYAAQAEKLA